MESPQAASSLPAPILKDKRAWWLYLIPIIAIAVLPVVVVVGQVTRYSTVSPTLTAFSMHPSLFAAAIDGSVHPRPTTITTTLILLRARIVLPLQCGYLSYQSGTVLLYVRTYKLVPRYVNHIDHTDRTNVADVHYVVIERLLYVEHRYEFPKLRDLLLQFSYSVLSIFHPATSIR